MEVVVRQMPFLVMAGLSTFAGGAALSAWTLLGFFSMFQALVAPRLQSPLDVYTYYGLFGALTSLPESIGLFVVGLAMMAGGHYLGLRDVLFAAIEHYSRGGNLLSFKPDRSKQAAPEPASTTPAQDWPERIPPEAMAYVVKRLEGRSPKKAPLAEELWHKFGIPEKIARELILQIDLRSGPSPHTSPALLFGSLAAGITGLVWVFQSVSLLAAWLHAHPREVLNQWHLVLLLGDIADFFSAHLAVLGFLAAGIFLMTGGLWYFWSTWPAVYTWAYKK
jgi:hypothetical protein